eukprot:TRINITY_DN14122_c0_g1_i1.p1 TRINITY_DN14122_c0_g1~~TRINITY_DN14122_c0_g1_i1.p1  ORF type:complete len:601 (-),score=91.54 TRINITY_DN14122_c0_g1_i1:306-2024(-)
MPDAYDTSECGADFFSEDEVFFGSVPVFLVPVPGKAVRYVHQSYRPGDDEASLKQTLARKDPIAHPQGGLPVVVPGMPRLDMVCDEEPCADVSDWPEQLRAPLIKVPQDRRSDVCPKAFASGVRSAVVKLGGQWYRLKGCGNNDNGFIVQEDATLGNRQIRGSAFEHTAVCENSVGVSLTEVMEPQGILGCNSPMGYYLYDAPNLPLGPGFQPACIVERTLGDRRLGTHVMAGIELIFDRLVDDGQLCQASLLESFPAGRPRDPTEGHGIAATATLMSDHMLAKMYGMDEEGLDFKCPRDATVFANALLIELPERAPNPEQLPQQYFRKPGGCDGDATAAHEGVKDADPRWQRAWTQACEELQEGLRRMKECASGPGRSSGSRSILAYLFSRIGFECGRFARELHKTCGVSWGTYADAMCYEGQLHCNAHANNLVVIPPAASANSYLAYLDLDMAFDDRNFVDLWGTGVVGASKEDHAALLYKEHLNFMEVLAGADTTSGVPSVAHKQIEAQSELLKLAKVALFDTLIMGYMHAYDDQRSETFPVAAFDRDMHIAGYSIIKLAIIAQAEYIA